MIARSLGAQTKESGIVNPEDVVVGERWYDFPSTACIRGDYACPAAVPVPQHTAAISTQSPLAHRCDWGGGMPGHQDSRRPVANIN